MNVTEDHIREELKKVIDPELFVNIVDLGLVYVIDVQTAGPEESGDPDKTVPAASVPEAPETPAAEAPASATPGAAAEKVKVKIEMTMTSPMCPAGPQLVAQSRQVVGQVPGVVDVEVKVVMDPPWTPDRMTDDARDQLGIF